MLDESFHDTNAYDEPEDEEESAYKTFRGKKPEKKFG